MKRLKLFSLLLACLMALVLMSCDDWGPQTPTVTFINETHIPINITSTSLTPNSFTLGPHSRRDVEAIERFPITYSFTWTNTGHRESQQLHVPNQRVIFSYR
jgi:hypothetical protein